VVGLNELPVIPGPVKVPPGTTGTKKLGASAEHVWAGRPVNVASQGACAFVCNEDSISVAIPNKVLIANERPSEKALWKNGFIGENFKIM
jgi:hypothetical protein